MLIVGSLAIAGFSTVYAFLHDYRILLALVLLHGVFWSGLLSASSAYITDIIPAHRRAEGISYWGLVEHPGHRGGAAGRLRDLHAGVDLGVRPAALNLAMAAIAWSCPPTRPARGAAAHGRRSWSGTS